MRNASFSILVALLAAPGCKGQLSREPCATSGACVVFLTSDEHTAKLGGLAGADEICQDRAEDADLPGRFKAWLSDSKTSAADRLVHSTVPYVDTLGQMIAADWADLTDGSLRRLICVDESGYDWDVDAGHCDDFFIPARVWTGTTAGGASRGPFCDDWTTDRNSTEDWGHTGGYCEKTGEWSDGGDWRKCAAEFSLYCIQQ